MQIDRQKIYVISGVALLVVIMVIGFFYYNAVVSKNKVASTTSTGPSTSGTGTLGTLPPFETTTPPTRPTPLVLHTDTSQPYATIAPRANEPAPTPTPVVSAAAPVAPPPQEAVNSAGMDSGMAFQYNDLTSLNETQLMQKYTPNYQNIDQTFEPPASSADGVAANGTDGVVTVTAAPPLTSIAPVALPAGVAFTVSQANDPQSLTGYLTQLSSTVAPFDISNPNNSSFISSAVTDAISDPSRYKSDLAAGQNMLAQLKVLPVPSDLAGLQDSYYNLYTQYVTLLQDAAGVSSSNQTTAIAADTNVQQDAAQFGIALETTLDDLNDAQTVIGNAGAGTVPDQSFAAQDVPAGTSSGTGGNGGAEITQTDGYDSGTQQLEQQPNVLNWVTDDYFILEGSFASSGNTVFIDSGAVPVPTSDQSSNELDVPVRQVAKPFELGMHTVTVTTPAGATVSKQFTVE